MNAYGKLGENERSIRVTQEEAQCFSRFSNAPPNFRSPLPLYSVLTRKYTRKLMTYRSLLNRSAIRFFGARCRFHRGTGVCLSRFKCTLAPYKKLASYVRNCIFSLLVQKYQIKSKIQICEVTVINASINVKPEGGGTPGKCGAFDLYCLPHPREFN